MNIANLNLRSLANGTGKRLFTVSTVVDFSQLTAEPGQTTMGVDINLSTLANQIPATVEPFRTMFLSLDCSSANTKAGQFSVEVDDTGFFYRQPGIYVSTTYPDARLFRNVVCPIVVSRTSTIRLLKAYDGTVAPTASSTQTFTGYLNLMLINDDRNSLSVI